MFSNQKYSYRTNHPKQITMIESVVETINTYVIIVAIIGPFVIFGLSLLIACICCRDNDDQPDSESCDETADESYYHNEIV
jgi:hypothetical protein